MLERDIVTAIKRYLASLGSDVFFWKEHGGSTIVWFGLNWSLELYEQANARLWRQGQKETVVIHHLVVKGTMDEQVMRALHEKAADQNALLAAVKARIEEVK